MKRFYLPALIGLFIFLSSVSPVLAVTVNLQVGAGSDDGYDTVGSSTFNTGTPLHVGGKDVSANNNTAGLRFTNVTIPQGATINSATLDFMEAWGGNYSTNIKTKIYGDDQDDCGTFSGSSLPRDRTKTTAAIDWDSNGSQGSSGQWYQTNATVPPPSIVTIIQEIVDRPSWASGNDLCLIIADDGSTNDWWFETRSYESAAGDAPKLDIDYTSGPSPTPTLTPTPSPTPTPALKGFTLSAWVNPTSTASRAIMVKNNELRLYTDASSFPSCQMYNSGSWLTAVTSSTALTTSSWQHVVCSYDGKRLYIFVNGQLTGTQNHDSIIPNNTTNPWRFGSDAGGTYSDFNGTIDDYRIYNRFLSSLEVANLYEFGPAPTAYWRFDDQAATTTSVDSSGNGRSLNNYYNGNPGLWRQGVYGSAMYFDGTKTTNETHADMNDTDLLDNHNQGTISFWFKADDVGDNLQALTGAVIGADFFNIIFNRTLDVLEIRVQSNTACSSGTTRYQAYTSFANNQTNWHHLSWVGHSSGHILYLDGVPQSLTYNVGDASDNCFYGTWESTATSPMGIGCTSAGGPTNCFEDEMFNGLIDDYRIYNYPRTPKQVLQDMNGGHPAAGSPIGSYVARWAFDDSSGTTAQEQTINDDDLTLSTASWTPNGKFEGAWNGTGGAVRLSRTTDPDLEFSATEDFTLSTWFKSDSATNPSAVEYIVASGGPAGSAGYAMYVNTSGQACFGIDDDTSWGPDVASCSSQDIYDNTWHHLAAVRNTTTDLTYLYIDGRLVDSDTDTTTATLDSSPTFFVGDMDTDDAGSGEELAGDLDELKVYRSALNQSEVLVDFNFNSAISLGSVTDHNEEGFNLANPTAWWKMNENTGTSSVDSSGNGYSSTLTNGPLWTTGKLGSAIRFDGNDDYMVTTSTSVLDTGSAYTVSLWAYPLSDGESSSGTLFAKPGNISIYMSATDSVSVCQEGASCGTTNAVSGNNFLPNNQWTHVVVVHDGTGGFNFYSNSVLLNGGDLTGPDTNTAAAIIFGASTISSTFNYDGLIDEVEVFNSVLTPAQISYLYNRGQPLVHFKLDECSGSVINNSSPNSNNQVASLTTSVVPGASGNTTTGSCNSGTSTEMWNDGSVGKYSGSLGFDGADDYATVTNTSLIDLNEALQNGLSVSVWVYANSSGEGGVGRLFTKTTDTWCRTDSQSGSNLDIECSLDLATTDATLNISSAITTGTWNHIVMSWTNDADDKITIWVNGINRGTSVSGSGNTVTDTANLILGNDSTSAATTFDGLIDDFKIFNYELSADQIRVLYNQGSAVRFGPATGTP